MEREGEWVCEWEEAISLREKFGEVGVGVWWSEGVSWAGEAGMVEVVTTESRVV
jgi:hypothetical protein